MPTNTDKPITAITSLFIVIVTGRLGGYRHMARVLRVKYHLQVPMENVRLILRQLDPEHVSARRQHRLIRRTYWSRGPNHQWHVDGYDKLSPYGFSISGYVICTVIIIFSNSAAK